MKGSNKANPAKNERMHMGGIIPANLMLIVLVIIFISIIIVNVIALCMYTVLAAYIRMKEL